MNVDFLYNSFQLDLILTLKCTQRTTCYCLDARFQQKWLWLVKDNFGMSNTNLLPRASASRSTAQQQGEARALGTRLI